MKKLVPKVKLLIQVYHVWSYYLYKYLFYNFLFSTGDTKGGLKKSELVAWYLDQIQDQIDSEEELLERKNFIEKIIDRLTYHVRRKVVI